MEETSLLTGIALVAVGLVASAYGVAGQITSIMLGNSLSVSEGVVMCLCNCGTCMAGAEACCSPSSEVAYVAPQPNSSF